MARLIDADNLIEDLKYIASSPFNCDTCDQKGSKTCIQCVTDWALSKAPTIEPVKRSKWFVMTTFDQLDRFKDYELECSCCHAIYRARSISIIEDWYKYCPHCGAKMDGW